MTVNQRHMAFRSIATILALALCAACNVSFRNSVEGEAPDELRNWISGSWVVEKLVKGETPEKTVVELVSVEGGGLELKVHEKDKVAVRPVELAAFDGWSIASVQTSEGRYAVFQLRPQYTNGKLMVAVMRTDILQDAIETKALDGVIRHFDQASPILEVSASAEDLRLFIEERQEGLFEDFAILGRP